jgi:hypothetical protein
MTTDYASLYTLWDRFLDALDLARQDEDDRIEAVVVPPLTVGLAAGKSFGELTRGDVESLLRQASSVGQRRVAVVLATWQDLQRKKNPPREEAFPLVRNTRLH